MRGANTRRRGTRLSGRGDQSARDAAMEKDFLGIGGRDPATRDEIGFFGRHPDRWPLSTMLSGGQPIVFLPAAEERSTGIGIDLRHSSAFRPIAAGDPLNSQPRNSSLLGRGMEPFLPAIAGGHLHGDLGAGHQTPASSCAAVPMNQQHLLNGFPAVASPMLPRNTAKPASGASAQLTIFYAGSICVFDHVPAEKAQALMFLASNASGVNSASVAMPTKIARGEAGDVTSGGPPSRAQSVSGSNASEELSVEQRAAGSDLTAIPLMRKASLTRFLERRKERMASDQPYPSPHQLDGKATGLRI